MSQNVGELLMEGGLLTKAQLQTALRTQEFFGGHLGSIFIELGFLKEPTLGEALARSTGARYAPPELLEHIPPQVYGIVPAKLAEKHTVLPLRVQGRQLHLAMLNPKDPGAMKEISALTGLRVVPYVCPEFRLLEALQRYCRLARRPSQGVPIRPPAEHVDPTKPGQAARRRVESAVIGATAGGVSEVEIDPEAEPSGDPAASGGSHTQRETEDLLDQLPRHLDEWHEATPGSPAPAEPGRRRPSATPTPTAKPVPRMNPLTRSARRLLDARSRDEIAAILLRVTKPFFRSRLLFIVQRDRIVGWNGQGDRVSAERVKKAHLPMDCLSLFTAVKVGARPMIGPVADVPANRQLFHDLGMDIPVEAVLLPIRIKGRVVAIFYGDNGPQPVGPVDVDLLGRFTLQAAFALEILILRGKLVAV